MKVLVSDSSILIEFSKRGVLDRMFALEFQFAVPDLLFHEELIDLGPYSRQDLLTFGLSVESLDVEGVELAIAYQSKRPALSLVDSFALALAGRQGWDLLTEDRTMRSVAELEGIIHRDAMWIVDNILDADVLTTSQVLTVLEQMRDDPRCPVPKAEIAERIRSLGV